MNGKDAGAFPRPFSFSLSSGSLYLRDPRRDEPKQR